MSPPLLHNMSCRPTTRIHWEFGSFAKPLVGFRADALAGERPSPAAVDAAWKSYGLTGAVLLYHVAIDGIDGAPGVPDTWASDPLLVLNVLGRARGDLLLPHVPMDWDAPRLERRFSSDDPRLIALALGRHG